jgi:hypothetical protein
MPTPLSTRVNNLCSSYMGGPLACGQPDTIAIFLFNNEIWTKALVTIPRVKVRRMMPVRSWAKCHGRATTPFQCQFGTLPRLSTRTEAEPGEFLFTL